MLTVEVDNADPAPSHCTDMKHQQKRICFAMCAADFS